MMRMIDRCLLKSFDIINQEPELSDGGMFQPFMLSHARCS